MRTTTKKIASIFAIVVLVALLSSACASQTQDSLQKITRTYTDFIDIEATIAVQSGDALNIVARDLFKAGEVPEYTNMANLLEDLNAGRVDAVMTNAAYIKQLEESSIFHELDYLWIPQDFFLYEAAPVFHNTELRDTYNDWLAILKADGTLDEITERWIGVPLPEQEEIPTFDLTGENGTLRVCATDTFPPLSYYDANNSLAGFNHEISSRFAQYLGMNLETAIMNYEAIIPYVLSGRADMSAAFMTITDERSESVIFGAPTLVTQAVLIVPTDNRTTLDYTAFIGKKIGATIGSVSGLVIEDEMETTPIYYTEVAAGIEDVRRGRIDGFMTDLSTLRIIAADDGNENLICVEVPIEFFQGEMGAISNNPELINSFNIFLSRVKADGTLAGMQKRWLGDIPDLESPMPVLQLTGENGTLRVATNGQKPPFSYFGANKELKGYSIELILRFAESEGMDVEFSEMEFSALIPQIISGRSDIAIANISITEERKQSVSFTDPIYNDQLGIITLRQEDQQVVSDGGGFVQWFTTAVERNLITDNRWMLIVNGLGVTMTIALMAQLFGTGFGCFVCYFLTRKNRFVNGIGRFFCGIINGLPIVVLLLIAYYIVFSNASISNVLVAVAAFTVVMGANIAQILKGAIDTVDPVEIEAARSIGFSAFLAFLVVTLPQAVQRALPAYTKGFVELVKATAVVGYIAIQDLTRASDIIISRTYDPYFPLLLVAVIYLIITTICVQFFKLIVNRFSGGEAE